MQAASRRSRPTQVYSDQLGRPLAPSGHTVRTRLLALLVAFQLAWFEVAVLGGWRFTVAPGGRFAASLAGGIVYLALIWLLLRADRVRTRLAFAAVAVILTVRFHGPSTVQAWNHWRSGDRPQPAELVAGLRLMSAAQEQYRLAHSGYAPSPDSLSGLPVANGVMVRVMRSATGWRGDAHGSGRSCSIWVRDPALRVDSREPEGSPFCAGTAAPGRHQMVSVISADREERVAFSERDVSGEWAQHRNDAARRAVGTTSFSGAYRWAHRVGGELRASAVVVGNQVFVGAHGNGEFAAFSLDSGRLGFRVRAPNWIHHGPVAADGLVIVGFGNSELSHERGFVGSRPSGVIAFDRRTGVERWRRLTRGSVMSSPALYDSIVAVATAAGEVFGWRLADGAKLWETHVPGQAVMSNPLLVDSLMVVSLDQSTICGLDVRNGERRFCWSSGWSGWGAGHASPAATHDTIVQVVQGGNVFSAVERLLGLPVTVLNQPVEVVAVSARDQRVLWRTNLGGSEGLVSGHLAGTPVIGDGSAFISLPGSGRVVSVRLTDGSIRWSTTVRAARGTITLLDGRVFAATTDSAFTVLEASTGRVVCRQQLPARSDRAGLTVAGRSGVLTLLDGLVLTRPTRDWLSCAA